MSLQMLKNTETSITDMLLQEEYLNKEKTSLLQLQHLTITIKSAT